MRKLPNAYIRQLVKALERKVAEYPPEGKLLMLSGVAMNSIADFVTDKNVRWAKKRISIDTLYLTGTNPKWNRVIIDRCHRSPSKLRALMARDRKVRALFRSAKYAPAPILVRRDKGKYKIFDGMNRVIAAIRKGDKSIVAYIASLSGVPRPLCEPHAVYDLIKAYQRGINRDRKGLIAALRFLRKSYANVDGVLRERFGKRWLPDCKLQKIIGEALR
mgnify:CR=1 FL=1